MSTGRICARCNCDIVLVCPCRTSCVPTASNANKRPRENPSLAPPTAAVASRSSFPTGSAVSSTQNTPLTTPPPTPTSTNAYISLASKASASSSSSQSAATTTTASAAVVSTGGGAGGVSLVGMSKDLERSYVRPSSAPSMHNVRPVHILTQSFALCIEKPRSELSYVSDQLKSIRQDLTVQNVDSTFAATVYEYHARVALCLSHLPEFGQCLNSVRSLHVKGYEGDRHALSSSIPEINPPGTTKSTHTLSSSSIASLQCSSATEFAAFRIAYTGLVSKFEDELASEMAWLERNRSDVALVHHHHGGGGATAAAVNNLKSSTSSSGICMEHPLVQFAIKAVNCRHNPPLYMALLRSAPVVTFRLLLGLFVPKLRIDWLKTLIYSVEEHVSGAKLAAFLGLANADLAAEFFQPILGGAEWRDGFSVKRHRERIQAYITEVTQQRGENR